MEFPNPLGEEDLAELESIAKAWHRPVDWVIARLAVMQLRKLRRARAEGDSNAVRREMRTLTYTFIAGRREMPPVLPGATLPDLLYYLDSTFDEDANAWAHLIRNGRLEELLPPPLWARLSERASALRVPAEDLLEQVLVEYLAPGRPG